MSTGLPVEIEADVGGGIRLQDHVGSCKDSDTNDCSCVYASTCEVDWYASGKYFAYTQQSGYFADTDDMERTYPSYDYVAPPQVPLSTPLRDACKYSYHGLKTCMNGFDTR